ncbi:tetratricopeptide repeat protein [Paraliomyxa miuraensis]|uniref:tetratricopeptide repeat protein n=1 Tax=Paraliomyxa miuraensis TaxID=376150 RepID=UPI0022503AD4|nr:tetratricopeptide repeat protein [Paraliomyxa miuraensis]MCX4242366.1 tetratricopeptide repeat protein [Paraliomyxa miuraensis]
MPPARPRRSRTHRAVLALAVALGTSLGGAGEALGAPGGDDWSLERRNDDPKLVSQRMAKLQRNPFDQAQWRALVKAIGLPSLAARIRTAHEARPSDVALQILVARVIAAEGNPAAAAEALAELEGKTGRHGAQIFEQRIDWLEAAGDRRGATTALMVRAEASRGQARDKLLVRAFEMADRGDLSDTALQLARTLASEHPNDTGAQLRLARAAARAGQGKEADDAFERAAARSPSRDRDDLLAERARARMTTDNPGGAAELLWSLLEPAGRASRSVRAGWWDELADAHRRAGTTDLLVARLGRWVADHPDEAAAWRTLAQAQETAGFDPTAAWRKVLELSPRDVESHTALVEALEGKGKAELAIDEYTKLAQRHPAEIELGLELAGRLITSGERERGLELAADIEARVARKPKALLLLLDFYNLNDEGDRALDVARRVVALKPRSADARVALGEQLYQMNHVDDALDQWAMLPKLIRPAHRGWAKHAEVLSEHGRTTDAVSSLKMALKAEPEEPRYLRLRAMLAEEQRRPDQALGLWEQVRSLASDREDRLLRDEARTRIVELLVGGSIPKRRARLDATEHAAQTLLDAGEPRDEAIEAGRLLAELYTRQENYPAAVTVQQRLFELAPDDPDRLAELASAQRRAGQVQSALGTLEDLLAAEPTRSADTLAEMSELAFEAGDADRALDAASQAAQRDSTRVDALIHLGELHERRGDIDEARRAYREAIEADPRDARARLRLAELSLTLGDTERSAEAFREILDLGGPPELLRAAGNRALDLAEASGTTGELFDLAVRRTVDRPEADEPRQFLLEALARIDPDEVERWLREGKDDAPRSRERVEHLRRPLVVALSRGSVGTRLQAAEHLGHLGLPDTALPLAKLGASLRAPRDATTTVRSAFDRARITAIDAAGRLRDPAAIPELEAALTDPSQSQGARHAAAWALAGIGGPEVGQTLGRYVETGYDPMLTSLGCLVLGRLPRDRVDPELARSITAAARDNASPTVRHACSFAEAALTPDTRVDRLYDQLRVTDPMHAAIAAWRLGRVAKPRATEVQALLERYLGPAGLPRDAAAAALVALLDDTVAKPPPSLPTPTHDRVWATTVERWLRAQVAPRVEPMPTDRLTPWADSIHAALEAAAAGTRAERDAAEQARCGATDGPPNTAPVCMPSLVQGPIHLRARD